jgi:hypothetical protein
MNLFPWTRFCVDESDTHDGLIEKPGVGPAPVAQSAAAG